MLNSIACSFLFILALLLTSSFGKVPNFSAKEKAAIDKLRDAVEHKLVLKYMKSDAYLYKWLRAKKFDHSKALEALEKCLEWREENDIDNLPFENHDKLAKQYFLDFTTVRDKEGLPVILFPMTDWDIRRKAIEGRISEILRRQHLFEEKGAQLGFNETGDPTAMIIVELGGISLRKHLCAACIPFYLNSLAQHENYYPYNMYRIVVINSPSILDPLLRILLPLMTDSTRIAFRNFGFDRTVYSAVIGETIDLNVLPHRFGGTKR